ncbi:MAG: hypothetical protein H6553_01215 [Chitinophagales bacterium]|nr:hypothetical protein [Chitinophagales bacterium]
MYKNKLIQTYISLNKGELRRLKKYIKSDFVNKNEEILAFFNFIDTRTTLNEQTVTKEKAHQFIFGNASYNDLKMRHLIWQTGVIIESFIIYDQSTNNEILKNQLLSNFYSKKELYKYAEETLNNNIHLIEQSTTKNAAYYLDLFKTNASLFDIAQRNIRSNQFNIEQIVHNSSVFAIIEALKYGCLVKSIQKLNEFEIEDFFINNIIDFLPNSKYIKNPMVKIYYNDYLLITTEEEEAFLSLEQDLKKHQQLFSKEEYIEVYANLLNYCVKRTNQNDEVYAKKAFQLYIDGVKDGILLEKNEINRFVFTNIVTLGIKVKSYAVIEQFIVSYFKNIDEDYRQNTYDFNQAKLYFAKAEYDKALQILLTNEFKDVLWNLNAKFIVLKIFFEQAEYQSFVVYLKSFKVYIKRKNNIGYHATYFNSVAKSLTQLQKIQKQPNKYKSFSFDESTADKAWFDNALQLINQSLKKQKATTT